VLILVRHGQTELNAQSRLVGRLDAPLTDLGRRQAAAAARAVIGSAGPLARVVASPLARARDTAAAFGGQVEVDDRWIELDYGTYDGLLLADVPSALWSAWRSDAAFTPPGGESLADLGRRVRQACDELAEDAAAGNVVVVSHVSPIKAAVVWALGADDRAAWRMYLDTGSICRIYLGPVGPSLRSFNETGHLGAP
jgi:broad specificity phosphatase PhoE